MKNELFIDKTGQIERPVYSYHYERAHQNDIFYFRYDRDPQHAKPILHEECHLHANGKVPRYKTHVTSFDEVFEFIVTGYLEHKWQGTEWID